MCKFRFILHKMIRRIFAVCIRSTDRYQLHPFLAQLLYSARASIPQGPCRAPFSMHSTRVRFYFWRSDSTSSSASLNASKFVICPCSYSCRSKCILQQGFFFKCVEVIFQRFLQLALIIFPATTHLFPAVPSHLLLFCRSRSYCNDTLIPHPYQAIETNGKSSNILLRHLHRHPQHIVHLLCAAFFGVAEHPAEHHRLRHEVQRPGALHAVLV